MPKYSQKSLENLGTCHIQLQELFNYVIQYWDCTILEGHRGEEAQNKAFAEKKSMLPWPKGKHNAIPSLAVDATPYPVNFNDREKLMRFAGFVDGIAIGLGIKIRWGGDWNGDHNNKDNQFDDLVHFELLI